MAFVDDIVKAIQNAPWDEVTELIRRGFPEETAKRIADGALDMSLDARRQRAIDQGYGDILDPSNRLYHGTSARIDALQPTGATTGARSAMHSAWSTDDPYVAGTYARYAAEDRPVQELINLSNDASRRGDFDLAEDLMLQAEELEGSGELVNAGGQNITPLVARMRNPMIRDVDGATMSDLDDSQLIDWLLEGDAAGNDGLVLQNFSDNADYGVYHPATHVATSPENYRSPFAAFDPEYTGRNIRGNATVDALAGTAVGGAAATAGMNEGVTDFLLSGLDSLVTGMEVPQRGLQGLARAAYGVLSGSSLEDALLAGADVVNQGVDETAQQFGDYLFDEFGNPIIATGGVLAGSFLSPI